MPENELVSEVIRTQEQKVAELEIALTHMATLLGLTIDALARDAAFDRARIAPPLLRGISRLQTSLSALGLIAPPLRDAIDQLAAPGKVDRNGARRARPARSPPASPPPASLRRRGVRRGRDGAVSSPHVLVVNRRLGPTVASALGASSSRRLALSTGIAQFQL